MIVVKVEKSWVLNMYFINYVSYHLTDVSIVSISQYFCAVQWACDNPAIQEIETFNL